MPTVNLKSLIEKLNGTCRETLEAAAGLCMSRTNYNVEVEHWLTRLLEVSDTDVAAVLKHYGVDPAQLITRLTKALDQLKTGNARPPALSPDVVQLAREAWVIGSVEFNASSVRSGHVLIAMLSDDRHRRLLTDLAPELSSVSAELLTTELMSVAGDTAEAAETTAAPAGPGGPAAPAGPGQALNQFTVDLTDEARAGRIDPVLGRDAEIRQIIDILTRRRQNNPILTGEPGVGKTAAVEGFALRVAAGDVPEILKNVRVKTLDMALLQAGAGMKGEFENRLKSVISEVKASPEPVILFIDEAHSLIGAGGSEGQGDAANLLKPALARGELRTIAATTWAEYKKYFERDAALARRFQVVRIEEPEEDSAIKMMRGMVSTLEAHHGVRILDEAVREAVRLSRRYISGRQLPDKSVSVLDTACATVAIGQDTTPAPIEDCRRRIEQNDVAAGILEREQVEGSDHAAELAELAAEKEAAVAELAELEQRWEDEKKLVRVICEIRDRLSAGIGDSSSEEPVSDDERERLNSQREQAVTKLEALQGDSPLVHVCVDGAAVAAVIGSWTGIPVGRMVADEVNTVLNLQQQMEESVVGQSHALEAIAESIHVSRANMKDPNRPIGVFLLAGTSGVGKTETAITLANLLYGGEQNMTTINMSEFKEEHKVSLLMGSPPGYVGYGEGGVLTEAVRRKPYSVVLLDEMEKAHPGVQDVFYQVFDKGMMKDGEGRDINFHNSLIIMTSNAGTDLIKSLCADPDTRPDADGLRDALHEELLKTFKPAFLGRVTVVPYFPLTDDVIRLIVSLKLGKVAQRARDAYKADFTWTDDLVHYLAGRCNEVDSGARTIDHMITRTILPEISREFLTRMCEEKPISSIRLSVDDNQAIVYQLD